MRSKPDFRVVVLGVALAAASGARAEMREFSQAGSLQIDAAAPRGATLHLACSPGRNGGAVSIELIVPEANTRKDFDYDDFEGPDAAAGGKALSHLAWTSTGGTTEIDHVAAGWYAPEPPESFMFGVSQLSHRAEAPARLLGAVGSAAGTLVWTQTGFDKATRKLVATFELDAAAAAKAHTAVAACLPAAKPGG